MNNFPLDLLVFLELATVEWNVLEDELPVGEVENTEASSSAESC
jgi:hypothetical protein